MEIKASQVKELRELSGVGMMECKKALVEVEGDIEKALDLLRSNSALKAEKKSARVAADGVIKVHVSENYATMVEINSETDFAAKDDSFIEFAKNIEERVREAFERAKSTALPAPGFEEDDDDVRMVY